MKLGNINIADVKYGSNQVSKIMKGTELVWQKEEPVIGEYCVIFENEGFTSISVQPKWTQTDVVIQYSFNGVNWTNAVSGTNIIRSDGNTIFFRGKAPTFKRLFTSDSSTNKWVTNATKITGNLNFLLCDTLGDEVAPTSLGTFAYAWMFRGCTSLTTPPELPATTMASKCYAYMFYGCTSLTTPPELPATTLANDCYFSMFKDCTSLTKAPNLPATTLTTYCYYDMFRGCTSLTTPPELPATTVKNYCYFSMFQGCTSFKVSATKTGSYTYAWRIPTTGTGTGTTSTYWNKNMLDGTGGTFTSNPTINTPYYVVNKPV